MKRATFMLIDNSIYAKRLGGVITKEQMRDLTRQFVHKPTTQTIYDFIGKVHPNVAFTISDDGYIRDGKVIHVMMGKSFLKKVADWFGI